MSALKRKMALVCLASLLSTHVVRVVGQSGNPDNAGLNTKIAHFELANQTIFDGIAKISQERIPLALGFERVLKAKFSDAPVPNPRFNLQFEGKAVKEILDTLCSIDARYTWSQDGATINVYPRAIVGDSFYLLNRKLVMLEINSITNIDDGLLAIAQQLRPPKEQIGIAQVGGGDLRYSEAWTATFEDLTVRQAINRLAAHMGPRNYWIFSGSQEFRTFSFFRFGFNPSEPK